MFAPLLKALPVLEFDLHLLALEFPEEPAFQGFRDIQPLSRFIMKSDTKDLIQVYTKKGPYLNMDPWMDFDQG